MTDLHSDDPLAQARRLTAVVAGDACRGAAVAVRSTAEQRAVAAMAARAGWEGPHRRAFDEGDVACQRIAGALEGAALTLAGRFDEVAETGGGW